ncbi:hypothetical protein BOX15_Mlig012607g3 [Macrostomum lignano]|uniref:Uncharacterized protein n=1 Tax=Macrostomum lignano TaxID=282301 RepID=A0A267EFZ1_9PLAT|nr:hypothetical protein BOX15_Mlig012607g2 [Macrostomum lignano]PAA73634.1 hypothetical protein BOX15_Mlig012607g1 [Macrostomum lignano]PAA91931.1 hypothetical protein BOX15_Mlig012607g3 [Macrostomum lignano]
MNPACCRPYCTPNCSAVLDPFCIRQPPKLNECYFNPFLHGQCLGINMNSEQMRKEIQDCQEEYKKKVWAILRKYAMGGEGADENKKNSKTAPTKQQKQKQPQARRPQEEQEQDTDEEK